MKSMCKRLAALILAVAMCLSLLSTTAWAADVSANAETTEEEALDDSETAAEDIDEAADDEGDATVSASSITSETYTYINPEYADIITEDDLVKPSEDEGDATVSAASDVEYVTTIEGAAEQLREGMKSRSGTIYVYYDTSETVDNTIFKEIFDVAMEHTGDPEEGDYLLHQYAGWNAYASAYVTYNPYTYHWTFTFTVTYFTTAEQEAEVTAKLETVMDSLNLDSKCDYEKILAIYDYICENVTYDDEHLSDDSYLLKHSAYAALINGTAVCQGYAVLLYRMALEADVDARYVAGANHGWNIVQLGDVYYNLDTTWDATYKAAGYSYQYFLLCDDTFGTDHVRSSTYTTDSFYEAYPMAASDYTLTSDSDHSWGSPAFTWSSDYSTCTAAFTCAAGDSAQTLGCTVTSAVTTAAACTTAGKETYTATVTFDGQTYTDIQTAAIPATGHSYEASVTDPTCTELGYTTYICSGCGNTYTADETEATGHTWDDGVVATEATCDDPGEKLHTCTVCQATKIETIPATGHTFGAPTFEWADDYSTATAIFACEDEDCDNTETKTAEVSVHTTEATCTEDGETVYTASVTFDGEDHTDTKTVTIPATGHSYESVVTDPTCTEGGYTTYTCRVCGDSYTGDETETLGHSYDSGEVTTEATCTEDGVKTYTCTVCGETYTETIPATGHSYESVVTDPTCTESGYTTYTCADCGDSYTSDETEALGHSYDSGKVTAEATCTEDGVKTYTCTVCGETYTEAISATGHSFENGVCTVCGTKEIINLSTGTITVASATYTGKALTPAVTVKDADGKTLTESTDYTVSYSNNVNYGTGKVTVTGIDNYTGTVEKTFSITYATPTLSSVSNTTSGVKVSWKVVTGAAKYRVFRKTGSGSWAKVGDTTSTSYTDTSVKSGTTYKYTVRCINSAGTSYTSSYNSTGLALKYLTAGNISSLTNTSKGITVKWSKVTGASGYYVYRKTSGGSYSKIATVTNGSTVSYSDTAVSSKNGTTYVYAVRPYSGSTLGGYTGKTAVRLTGVSISSLKNSASKKMTVKWGKNSKATGYQIQYSTSSDFSSGNKTVTVSGAETVSKTISSLTKGKKYYVRVRAYKTVSGTKYYSAWSGTKNVKISK